MGTCRQGRQAAQDKAEEKKRTLYQSAVQTIGGPDGAAKFVLALASDPSGCLWIGTEGAGLWRFDPAAERKARWANFKDAGHDNVYAIACDQSGRIWCGSKYCGVSVFNGKEWRNYDRVSGALGERVYAIVCNPLNGEVWIATNCGLTRYLPATDSWKQYTRMDNLPSTQIGSLCFDATGNLYAGTLCVGDLTCPPSRAENERPSFRFRKRSRSVHAAHPRTNGARRLPFDERNRGTGRERTETAPTAPWPIPPRRGWWDVVT